MTDTLPLTWVWLFRCAGSFEFLCAHQRPQPGECAASNAQRQIETSTTEELFLTGKVPGAEEWVEEVAVYVSPLTSLIPFLLLLFPDSSVIEGPSLVCFLAACAVNLALQ